MTYRPDRDLHLTFAPKRGYWNFVLYLEQGWPMSALHASQRLTGSRSVYASEWLARLVRTEPTPMHVMLAGPGDGGKLWDPCVYEDPNSRSAVGEDGCVCWRTSVDPVTMLPVVAEHTLMGGGEPEQWEHFTYTLLELPEGERLDTLIIDNPALQCWVRTTAGSLHFMPEAMGRGYGWGYGGTGPAELASLIEQIVESNGMVVAPAGLRRPARDRIASWARDEERKAGVQEFSLHQLRTLCG
ncbi:hypothetical protein [Catellatospora chokoriensis]|uniref:Uncharacterized protein n=1 Tax=Catellatospora chokoriensis TaxID=310353 RepID=A0A8J3K8V6_9ACTN|nr:hypothetical protein [Catellatospora chokoriensis]GIF90654.1 hypothetical protein Cch02nite_40980 [Catellatospora chokoriensis]